MKYNERSGEFERTGTELVGYYAGRVGRCVGYVGWWIWKGIVIVAKIAAICMIARWLWWMLG